MAIFKRKVNNEEMPKNHTADFNVLYQNVKKSYVKYTTNLGAHVFHLGKFAVLKAFEYAKRGVFFIGRKTKAVFLKLHCSVKKFVGKLLLRPRTYVSNLKASVSEKKKTAGVFSASRHCVAYVSKTVWHHKGLAVRSLNYIAPVVAIAFLISLVNYASDVKYAISVECNGKVVGYISEEATADEAQKVVQDRISGFEGNGTINVETKLSVTKVSPNEKIDSVDQLADKFISNSDVKFIDGYGFYINGKLNCVVKEKTQIENTLQSLLDKYKTNNPTEVVEFVDKFEFKAGLYKENSIVSDSEIIKLLTSQKQVEAYYTVVAGDAPTSIAQKVGLPYADLKALNPTIEQKCMIGQKVLINRPKPYASVRITRDEQYDIPLAYNTVSVQDSTKYKGTQTTLVKGENGSAHVSAKVAIVDGYEESRNVVSQSVTKQPVDQKVSVGTKSTGASAEQIAAAGGKFLWPVGGGYVSQGFKGYAHKGIDIASNGAYLPIYAAQDGRVVSAESGWGGGYGNNIIIDHGNGYTTHYAHLSKILVPAGTQVSKGDLIGIMGHTGSSSGTHLHFEVSCYGNLLNPMNFLQ